MHIIEVLFDCNDWVKYDREKVELGDFELSAALWLLKVRVRRLALAKVQSRSAIDVALDSEEKWLFDHDSKETKMQIKSFATDPELWRRNIDTMVKERVGI